MKQAVDVLAVFDIGAASPRPLRFKVLEQGIKNTVKISNIRNIEWVRSGGVTHVEYDCTSVNNGRHIDYKLLYYSSDNRWELQM